MTQSIVGVKSQLFTEKRLAFRLISVIFIGSRLANFRRDLFLIYGNSK